MVVSDDHEEKMLHMDYVYRCRQIDSLQYA